jgi:hypothetical protein
MASKAFDVAMLPTEGELVIARMATRNEPFGIGLVVTEPTLRSTSSPPQRTHTLILQRNESMGGVVRAAAAAPAAPTRSDTPQPEAAQPEELSSASFEVQVHWYDLEREWVSKLHLLDDKHWASEYIRHEQQDRLVASQIGRQPPSAGWIVEQYREAIFLPKPGQPVDVRGILGVASLIIWGSRDALLTAGGQLTPKAFDTVWNDLVEVPRGAGPAGPGNCKQVAAAHAKGTASSNDESSDDGSPATSRDDDCSMSAAAATHSNKRRSKPGTPAATAAKPKRRRTTAAPSSAPSLGVAAGRAAGATSEHGQRRTERSGLHPRNTASAAIRFAAAAAAAPAADTACATASSKGEQCGNCERLQSDLLEMAQDLEAVRRFVTSLIVARGANSGIITR